MEASSSSSAIPTEPVPKFSSEYIPTVREKRLASHSHIAGLGLNVEGFVAGDAGGFIGQTTAREVCTSSSLDLRINYGYPSDNYRHVE